MEYDTIIIGAGLTGLTAAHHLKAAHRKVVVLEQGSRIGGRVGSTTASGFVLDHGFQVFLSSYRELNSLVDFAALGPSAFARGAILRRKGSFLTVRATPRSLFAGIFTVSDLIKIGKLVLSAPKDHPRPSGVGTLPFLRELGFSETSITNFFKPFFSGVFLDGTLIVDSGIFHFLLGRFAVGNACLLRDGAQGLPDLIAKGLEIRLETKANEWNSHEVKLESGDLITAQSILVTGTGCSGEGRSSDDTWYPTVTLYFSTKHAPYLEPLITLNVDEDGPITNLQVLTNVQPKYAPPGFALVSISIIGDHARKGREILVAECLSQARAWFGDQVGGWEFLRSFHIARALPKYPQISRGFAEVAPGVLAAGDEYSYGSQNGAVRAGREVAEFLTNSELGRSA